MPQLTENDVAILVRLYHKLSNINFVGMGGAVGPESITIGPPLIPQQQTTIIQQGGGLFYVTCMLASGVAGNKTTQCTYTYTIKGDDGKVIANTDTTPLSPLMQRPSVGKTSAALIGIARYSPTNPKLAQLIWCDEVPTKAPC